METIPQSPQSIYRQIISMPLYKNPKNFNHCCAYNSHQENKIINQCSNNHYLRRKTNINLKLHRLNKIYK